MAPLVKTSRSPRWSADAAPRSSRIDSRDASRRALARRPAKCWLAGFARDSRLLHGHAQGRHASRRASGGPLQSPDGVFGKDGACAISRARSRRQLVYKKIDHDFQHGLKLAREKTNCNRFFITRKALLDPEAYIGNLIRNVVKASPKPDSPHRRTSLQS